VTASVRITAPVTCTDLRTADLNRDPRTADLATSTARRAADPNKDLLVTATTVRLRGAIRGRRDSVGKNSARATGRRWGLPRTTVSSADRIIPVLAAPKAPASEAPRTVAAVRRWNGV
jgi:hypothetical protein